MPRTSRVTKRHRAGADDAVAAPLVDDARRRLACWPFLEYGGAFHDPSIQVTSGGKLSTSTGDNESLHEVELDVRAELALTETGQPAVDVPIDEWLVDPEDEQHYEVGLRGLLGAVEALEGGSRDVSREPEPAPTANAGEVERHPCPHCSVESGSPCRSRRGTVAAMYHTARFRKVPRLAKRLRVPTPADRGPGQPWRPGTPPPAPVVPTCPRPTS
jgi:hypothetical protein